MVSATSKKIKTGLFVAIGFAILLFGVFLIGKQKNMFGSTFDLSVNFNTVNGLQVGNAVRFAGINVGTVDNITIMNDTTVKVDLVLQNKVKPFIHKNAIASIAGDGLMGDKLIALASGTDSAGSVKGGEQILAKNPYDMDKLIARADGIATSAENIMSGLSGIITRVNRGEGSLGKLLNSDQLAKNLENTVASANSTVKSIKKGADGFSDNMQAAKSNFLLKGFFKKKEKKRIADSIAAVKAKQELKKPKKD